MIFTEKFKTITSQTTKDLAGWHVCLDVIKSLLDGKPIDSREEEWEKAHSKYEIAIKELV